ncbi:MAG: ABC transporter ATP-binding protein [Candidatus Onthovivens sp.]|nr:ABC transporter ATP-binding protein [Candidatus Onthovivens sp.]
MSEVELNLRIAKRQLRNDGIEKELKLINDFSFKNLDHVEALKLIINYNLSKEKIVKESYKAQRPGLAKILKLKKKEAHGIVNNYHHDLINIKKAKLDVLNKSLKDKETEFNIYKESLNKEVLNKYLMILKENERLTKEKEKRDRRFKENSISKTSKETLDLKTIEDAKFNKYIEDIKEIKKQIYDVYEEYISKTKITRKEAKRRALEVMKEVGIPLPERRFKQYAFEFSGGMRQRIVIAIALTANPEVLICDEPTTALDVTIQAQILELINKLKKERNLSCIFITHDLGVVANMADRVAVMYAGKIVEYGLVNEIFFEPKHPYTWALLSSIPDVDSKEKLEAIPGTPPDMVHPPVGDAFALRSKYAMAIDFKYEPPYFKVSDTHYAATWLLYPGAPKVEMPQIVKTRIANALKGYNKKDFSKEEE